MSRCRCERVEFTVEGQIVEGIVRVDPDCPTHGRSDEWRVGDPLRRHARTIRRRRQRTLRLGDSKWVDRWTEDKLETPREVEARLLAEMRAA